MKKTVLYHLMLSVIVCCFCCVPGLATADEKSEGYGQGGMMGHGEMTGHGGMMKDYDPKKSFEEFSRKLNLSKQQQEKIRPMLNQEVSEIKKAYAAAWEKEKRILEQYEQKVMKVLNPEQQKTYRKMIADRKKMGKSTGDKASAGDDIPVVITVVVAEPVVYYGKSVLAEGYVKRALTDDAFILSEAPNGRAEIVVVGAGPAVVNAPKAGEKVAVRGVVQNFKIDEIEKALGVDLDEGIFGMQENKPGIFARWVKKL